MASQLGYSDFNIDDNNVSKNNVSKSGYNRRRNKTIKKKEFLRISPNHVVD